MEPQRVQCLRNEANNEYTVRRLTSYYPRYRKLAALIRDLWNIGCNANRMVAIGSFGLTQIKLLRNSLISPYSLAEKEIILRR